MMSKKCSNLVEWATIGVAVGVMFLLNTVDMIHDNFAAYMAILMTVAVSLIAVTVWGENSDQNR